MLRLRRLLLDSVGTTAARFSKVMLDFTDGAGDPLDSILWSRNGAGKTSVLALFFSLLLPNQRDFLGARPDGRALADYVLTGDTAHVVAEWQTPWGPLVTGAVYEWPDRRRPSDYVKHQGELTRRWYVFTPVPGVLSLDELPVRLGGRKALLHDFGVELRRLGREHPALGLGYADTIDRWNTALKARAVDPGVFRYQKDMNRAEGAIDERFRFSSDEAFIDFLVDMVADEEAPESVVRRMRGLAEKLSQRKDKTAELTYCEGVAERLGPVQTAWAEQQRLQADLVGVAADGARLAGQLRAAQATAIAAAAAAEERMAAAAARLTEANTNRLAARDTALEYRRLGANLWVAEATDRLKRVSDARDTAALDQDAWQAVELLLAMERLQAEIADIEVHVTAQAAKAEPARQRRNATAQRLRARLTRLGRDADAAHQQACRREAEQLALADRAAKAARHQYDLAAQASARLGVLVERLEEQVAAHDRAVAEGHLLAGEVPAQGLARARTREADLAGIAARLDAELTAKQDRQGQILEDEAAADKTCRDAEQQRDAALAEAAQLREVAEALAQSERLRGLAQTTTLTVWAAAATLQRRLQEQIADAGRRMAEEAAKTLRDRRALAALADHRLLPPPEEVDAVMAVLGKAHIRATPGLAFLAESVRRDAWEKTISAHPGLLSGVLVDPGDYQAARAALLEAGHRPASLVTLAPKTAVLDADHGEHTFVVPPRPALFDPEHCDAEGARLAERLGTADQRQAAIHSLQEADRQLLERLRDLLVRCPTGYLDALDRRAAGHEERAAVVRARLEGLAGERAELAVWLREASARRNALGEQRQALTRSIAVLEPLADAFAAREALEQERDEAAARIRAARLESEQAEHAESAAQVEASAAHDQALAFAHDLRQLTDQLTTVTLVGDGGQEPADDPTLATDLLEDAFRRLDEAYWGAVDTAVLQDRRARAERDLRAAADQHAAVPEAARARAVALRAGPTASDPRQRAAARAHARSEHDRLLGEAAVCQAELTQAKTEQVAAAPPRGKVFRSLPQQELPTDRADAKARQGAAEAAAQRHQLAASEATQDRDRADEERRMQDNRAKVLGLLASGLINALGTLGVAPPTAPDAEPYPGSDEDATAAQEAVVGRLRDTARRVDQARSHLHSLLGSLRQFAQRFAAIGSLRDVIMLDEPEAVAADAERLVSKHRERAAVLREDLASIAEDQEILVGDLAGQVRQLADLLARTGKVRLPDGLGAWRGKPFLTITFEDPTVDEVELRRRIGAQVETIIDRGGIPDGVATLKQALHAAVPRGFRARLLKPTVDLTEERVPVTVMGKWSGGEKLTAAVALYCTLARLRAGARTKRLGDDSGALVLDNPLGKSSYVGFVALQRRIAAFLHVQLIYTTAVRDLKAVGRFPNVIRCRNIRPAGHSRSFLVVAERLGEAHGTPVTGVVSSARVVRLDHGDASALDGDAAAPAAPADHVGS
jgi:hypothetical protein